jgi:hypothetical protein
MREQLGKEKLWEKVRQVDPYFFERLELMPDALDLIDGLKANGYDPAILTGSPVHWADIQKWKWGHLWIPSVPMVVTKAKEKHLYCLPGDVLIDDRTKYQKLWEDAGGIFIVHTSAKSSLEQLKKIKPLTSY